ncbi:MAG: PTS sugar transporter subunit IIC [Erysipelotrichia bacterium]|nr:PTS sugar transporter subunit IIC [Erysipelotrichia bacterium]
MTSKNEVKKEGRIMHFIETKIAPLAIKMSQQIHLKSIMSAFLSCMPFMIIGSFALILWEPPVDYSTLASTNILYGFFKGWSNFAAFADPALNLIFSYTLGSLSFYVAIGVSYFLSKNYKLKPYLPVAVTGMVFFMLNTSFIEDGLSTSYFDGTGLFAAMLVSILSTEFYRVLIENKVGALKCRMEFPPHWQIHLKRLCL